MGQLDVTVAGRSHRLACEDGQERRLAALADQVDGEVRRLQAEIGSVGEPRLLLMAALVFADRLGEATEALRRAERALAEGGGPAPGGDGAPQSEAPRPGQRGLFDSDEAVAALRGAVARLEEAVTRREAAGAREG
jgi:cell division protein ZapA